MTSSAIGATERPQPRTRAWRTERSWLDRLLDYGIYIALGALIVYFSIASPFFLSGRNLLNIAQAVSNTGILAAGLTIALIAGQLDLSFGAVVGLTSVLVTNLALGGMPLLTASVVAILVGLLVGLLNGELVVRLGISPIIATLATGTFLTGAAYLLASGRVVQYPDASTLNWVHARPLGIPLPVIILAAVYVTGHLFLTRTRLGWHIYATGGNRSAALRAGIHTGGLFRIVLVLSALLAVLAGVLVTARTAAGDPAYGSAELFGVLTAVLLGGIGLAGGAGRIERSLVGVLIIGVLANGLVLMDVQSYYQRLIQGVVFVLAVILDAVRTKRNAR